MARASASPGRRHLHRADAVVEAHPRLGPRQSQDQRACQHHGDQDRERPPGQGAALSSRRRTHLGQREGAEFARRSAGDIASAATAAALPVGGLVHALVICDACARATGQRLLAQHTAQLLAGVTVTETLPDWVLDAADEVEMIDQSPEGLRERVRRGVAFTFTIPSPAEPTATPRPTHVQTLA